MDDAVRDQGGAGDHTPHLKRTSLAIESRAALESLEASVRSPFGQGQASFRNQVTVAATASGSGVALQPKARSNLLLSTTQGRSD